MNRGRVTRPGRAAHLPPLPPELDDPIEEPPPDDAHRCPAVFPQCPEIRCTRHLHRADVACTATGRTPRWWSCFWSREDLPNE